MLFQKARIFSVNIKERACGVLFFLSETPLCLFCKRIYRNSLCPGVQPVSVSRGVESKTVIYKCLSSFSGVLPIHGDSRVTEEKITMQNRNGE